MAPHLLIALVGLLYILFFGALSLFRREGISLRFAIEAILLTALAVGLTLLGNVSINPALFVFVLYLVTMRVRLLVDLGNLLARRGNHAAAARVYIWAHRRGPDDASRLLILLNQGVLALHCNRLGEAMDIFRRVLAASSTSYLGVRTESACHYNLGVAYQRQGLDAQAVLEFNAVLETWPATEYARYARIALEKRKRKGGTRDT
ncbi:MAG: tetratricopeptide repeat protein [Anaerolineae bacterium]